MASSIDEPGALPNVEETGGGGSEASRRSPETVAPKPETPPPPKPKVEVKVRRLPATFYVGAGIATLGVVVMLWASWRRNP